MSTLTVGRATAQDVAAYKRALLCDPCAYCGSPAEVLDHIVPKAEKGPDGAHNLIGACRACNAAKTNRTLLGYLGLCAFRRDTDSIVEPLLRQRHDWSHLGRRYKNGERL